MKTIKINKTGLLLETSDFPQEAKDFIFDYGLRQILNDCHSSIKRADFETEEAFAAEVNATVTAKLKALEEGKFTVRSGGTREPVDPVAKIVFRSAKDVVTAAIKSKGVKVKDLAEGVMDKLIADYIEANREQLTKEAKAQLKKAEAIEVNLADLGL